MRPETAAALFDMFRATERILEATRERSFQEFADDWFFQSAIERQFEVLGEALVRVRELERPVFDVIPDAARIVGLRNIIAHGYDQVDPSVLWSVADEHLAPLRSALTVLLEKAERLDL